MSFKAQIKGVKRELDKAEMEMMKVGNTELRRRAFLLYSHLKHVTPVDTGRARNSWYLSNEPGDAFDAKYDSPKNPTFVGSMDSKRLISIYLSNGVPYIDELNAGSSKQAAPRFIEHAIDQYFP